MRGAETGCIPNIPGVGCKEQQENPINVLEKGVQRCRETCGESLLAASLGLSLEGLFY